MILRVLVDLVFRVQEMQQSNPGKKNPAYGRQSISRPKRIVAPIPKKSC